MLQTTRAIVLKSVKHGDHSRVLKTWTSLHGACSFLVRIGKRNGVSDASLQALNRLELVFREIPDRELQVVRELRVERPYVNVPHDPVRATLALFVQEVLYKVLRTGSCDGELDRFLHEALEVMDNDRDLSCYPIVFLVQLSAHLGFFPAAPEQGEDRFDLKEGHFVAGAAQHGHTMRPSLSMALVSIMELGIQELNRVKVAAQDRQELLDHLLLYYQLHVEGFGEMRSPAILHQLLR